MSNPYEPPRCDLPTAGMAIDPASFPDDPELKRLVFHERLGAIVVGGVMVAAGAVAVLFVIAKAFATGAWEAREWLYLSSGAGVVLLGSLALARLAWPNYLGLAAAISWFWGVFPVASAVTGWNALRGLGEDDLRRIQDVIAAILMTPSLAVVVGATLAIVCGRRLRRRVHELHVRAKKEV